MPTRISTADEHYWEQQARHLVGCDVCLAPVDQPCQYPTSGVEASVCCHTGRMIAAVNHPDWAGRKPKWLPTAPPTG
jgi:hypothetical protein